jgi:hypothetical protein
MSIARNLGQEWVILSDYYVRNDDDIIVESSSGRLILCIKSADLETGKIEYLPLKKHQLYCLK